MKIVLSVLSVLLTCYYLPAQSRRLSPEENKKIDYVLMADSGHVLVKTKGMDVWRIAIGDPSDRVYMDSCVTDLTLDNNHDIIFGYSNGEVKRYEVHTGRWELLARGHTSIHGLFLDAANSPWMADVAGVENLLTHEIYVSPEGTPDGRSRMVGHSADAPSAIYNSHDEKQRVWLGFHFGEWGGSLYVFSLRDKKFLPVQPSDRLSPVYGVFPMKGKVYSFHSSHHMSSSVTIARYQSDTGQIVFEYRYRYQDDDFDPETFYRHDHAFEAIASNPADSSVYLSALSGIYRIKDTVDVPLFKRWELLIAPGYSGRPPVPVDISGIRFCQIIPLAEKHLFLLGRDGVVYEFVSDVIRRLIKF